MAKPTLKPAAPQTPRERIWVAIRKLRRFDAVDLAREVARIGRVATPPRRAIGDVTVVQYCTRLERADILLRERDIDTPRATLSTKWQLARDTGVDAPHLDARGREITTGRWREQAWRAMRIARGDWDCAQLAAMAATEAHPVRLTFLRTYVGQLVRSGYVQIVRESTRKEPARLRLITGQWTGPRPPQVISLTAVLDRNTGKTVMLDSPLEVADETP